MAVVGTFVGGLGDGGGGSIVGRGVRNCMC